MFRDRGSSFLTSSHENPQGFVVGEGRQWDLGVGAWCASLGGLVHAGGQQGEAKTLLTLHRSGGVLDEITYRSDGYRCAFACARSATVRTSCEGRPKPTQTTARLDRPGVRRPVAMDVVHSHRAGAMRV